MTKITYDGGSAKTAGYVRKLDAENTQKQRPYKLTPQQEKEKKTKFNLDKVKDPSKHLIAKWSNQLPLAAALPIVHEVVPPVPLPVQIPIPLVAPHYEQGQDDYDDFNAGEFQNYVKDRNKKNKLTKADKIREAEELRQQQARDAAEQHRHDLADQRQDLLDEYNEIKQQAIKYKKAYDAIDNDYSNRLKKLAGDKQYKKAQKEELHEKILTERNNKYSALTKDYKEMFTYMKKHKLDDSNAVHKHVNIAIKKLH